MLASFIFLAAVHSRPLQNGAAHKIVSIQVSSIPGFVRNGISYVATLKPNGRMSYRASGPGKHSGSWIARFPPHDFRRLAHEVATSGFWGLQSQYRRHVTDMGTVIVTVRWPKGSKSVEDYGAAAPDSELKLERDIEKVVEAARHWKQTGHRTGASSAH